MSEHKYATVAGKEVIYIDVDDEITGIIDKVRGSKQRIVALVLPKRATVLQSIVNMKLLKRTADDSKKNLVLITSEAGLLPLAGSVGLHVARTLQSKPEKPQAPEKPDSSDVDNVLEASLDSADVATASAAEPALDASKPVGDLAAAGSVIPDADTDDAIEIDSADLDNAVAADGTAKAVKKAGGPKGPRNKKLKIPNFDKFRLWIILGGAALVLLIVFWYFAIVVLPKATVLVKTDSQAVSSQREITLNPAVTAVDTTAGTIPAQAQQTQKTLTQQVPATGQRNDGEKASGQVTLTARECGAPTPAADVPAGAGVSSGGLTFITSANTTFTPTSVAGGCINFKATAATAITAQNGGSNYNVSNASFTVAGRADVSGTGSASGGTDQITKIVAQSDIDSAKQKISAQDPAAVKQELKNVLLSRSLFIVEASFSTGSPEVTATANPGDQAENVTVTEKITYTLLGVKKNDLEKVIAADVNKHIDPKRQVILDFGLDEATFSNVQPQANNVVATTLHTTAIAGSQLDVNALKKQVAGKKASAAKSIIKANPGVTDVTVSYSPFWVSSIPKSVNKITITVEKPRVSNDGKP